MAAETALVGGSAEKLAEDVVRDTAAMVEMINNLLDNALKFTPKGGSVSLSLEETPGFVQLPRDGESAYSD